MDAERMLDRVRWANNVSARSLGELAVVYRPKDEWRPLDPAHRYIRLPVLFMPTQGGFDRTVGYGIPFWVGIYDAAYTDVGDYIVMRDKTWFIASQDRFLPNLCVETNRRVSFARGSQTVVPGANAYAGLTARSLSAMTGIWPASVLGISASGHDVADLPTDVPISCWTVLLPRIGAVLLKLSDMMTDDLGRTGIIMATELTRLGWRLTVRDTTT